jgi:hypothetical protein
MLPTLPQPWLRTLALIVALFCDAWNEKGATSSLQLLYTAVTIIVLIINGQLAMGM